MESGRNSRPAPAGPYGEPGTTRRRFLRAAIGGAATLYAGGLLAGCRDTTLPAGTLSPSRGPGGLPLGRPGRPVTFPIYPDNRPIPSGLKPEKGPLKIYNWAEYLNPAVIKDFQDRFDVEVELSTFSSIEEAVAKLASGAVQFDLFVPTVPYLGLLVAGRIGQPLNHSYIPNLKANVWSWLTDPWYDGGSRYTVPYTTYTTGIAWRNDHLPDFDPYSMRNPYEAFWRSESISGKVGMVDDQRDALSLSLLRLGHTDINTDSEQLVNEAAAGLSDLVGSVNLKFTGNEYQRLIDGSSWLQQAWSGDMAAITFYLPKGMSPDIFSYWWPRDGRGMIANDTFMVLNGSRSPVLAHLFLNYILDLEVALKNYQYVVYQQPLNGFTVEKVLDLGIVPRNLLTTIVREDQFSRGYAQAGLSQKGLVVWQQAWAKVKST
ncbi:MAG: extracellular solute-binding protein [Solirubrobacterales bacterium]